MSIPILHHNFDATGLESFYNTPFKWLLTIIILILIFLIVFILAKCFYCALRKLMTSKLGNFGFIISFFSIPILFGTLFVLTISIGFSSIQDTPKLFSSNEDGGTILKPVESIDNLPEDGILSELGLIRKYDENNTLLYRYSDEFVKEMKNNEKMKEYTIPECELNNPESIICGGDKLSTVQANKGDKTVTLTPHVEIDSDKADIDVDNPKDKGVQVYYWIEET